MPDLTREDLLTQVRTAAEGSRGLRLLLLFGSRARRDAAPGSDWDFAYLADEGFNPDVLLTELIVLTGTERVDLVDLARANGLLRYRAAADGKPIFQADPEAFARFWFEAVSFWCDAQPILEAGYEAALARLSR